MPALKTMLLTALLLLIGSVVNCPAEENPESAFLSKVRQLTFTGQRAGEGYFQQDGQRIIFQSEREADNPFFQIYLLDLKSGATQRLSPGYGKTTCSWLHPDGQHALFASTHRDPHARDKQREELEMRAQGEQRRYSWDYDEYYDLFQVTIATSQLEQLTDSVGYDAEGSWSPDGNSILFASNRRAYDHTLTDEEQQQLDRDPAYFIDLYEMDVTTRETRPLTATPGYDGGPFYSPDGSHICWRRFSENGAIAEVYTMARDGSDERQLTRLGAMSWAPFYHPSGQYLIFTTNLHGFDNFELYIVDTQGKSTPVRVTDTAGFDGLPTFSPDGTKLLWTSQRNASRQSQLFWAHWNHAAALKALGLEPALQPAAPLVESRDVAEHAFRAAVRDFSAADVMRHVDYLCRPELEGRLTGTPGEQYATEYVAAYFDHLGLQPAGDDGGWFQPFTFTSGVSLGANNRLARGERKWAVDHDWRPLSFSASGPVEPAEIVFAGYGIVAPQDEQHEEYDSYVHLEVRDRWVMVLRDMPDDVDDQQRQHLSRFSTLRYKAMQARDRGARGLIVAAGPLHKFRQPLIPLQFDGSQGMSSLPVICITSEVAREWISAADKDLEAEQRELDTGAVRMGFVLPGPPLSVEIEMRQEKRVGRNVLARLPAEQPNGQTVVVGAHVDHLGRGHNASSLAREDEQDPIHYGADDNASGVAAMLEIAEYLSHQEDSPRPRRRDLLFAAWSGEELGLLGSNHFVKTWSAAAAHQESHAAEESHDAEHAPIYPSIAACLNLDMVGRMTEKLILQGLNSSPVWPELIERCNVPVGLSVTLQDDSYLPTDASSFYVRFVPILSAFTGSHSEYHTPRDTPEKLNYEGAAQIAELMARIAMEVSCAEDPPAFVAPQRAAPEQRAGRLRAYLGTVPDYAETDVPGVKLSGVGKGGPAEQAGVRGGDVIVELAGKKIENIYDYTFAIEALKIGRPTTISVRRGEEVVKLNIVPLSRE